MSVNLTSAQFSNGTLTASGTRQETAPVTVTANGKSGNASTSGMTWNVSIPDVQPVNGKITITVTLDVPGTDRVLSWVMDTTATPPTFTPPLATGGL